MVLSNKFNVFSSMFIRMILISVRKRWRILAKIIIIIRVCSFIFFFLVIFLTFKVKIEIGFDLSLIVMRVRCSKSISPPDFRELNWILFVFKIFRVHLTSETTTFSSNLTHNFFDAIFLRASLRNVLFNYLRFHKRWRSLSSCRTLRLSGMVVGKLFVKQKIHGYMHLRN